MPASSAEHTDVPPSTHWLNIYGFPNDDFHNALPPSTYLPFSLPSGGGTKSSEDRHGPEEMEINADYETQMEREAKEGRRIRSWQRKDASELRRHNERA